MLFRVPSAAAFDIKVSPVPVEADLGSGQKPNFMTVGLPDAADRENGERVKAALHHSGFPAMPR
jgi:magnesium chelatase family protein